MGVAQQVEALLERVVSSLLKQRRLPESTYRLQFHAGFRFEDARRLVPYLHDLGITDCYASPYLQAQPGSTHGYDISDHRRLNPEVGSEGDYEAWVEALHHHGMGQILDVVPNHMGIVGNTNVWWNDVLENGPSSPHAHYFDIDWYPHKDVLQEKVLLPVLGEPYGKVLESQQLRVGYEDGSFAIHYFDHRFPLAPETAQKVLRHGLRELEGQVGPDSPRLLELHSILTSLDHLPPRTTTAPAQVAERQREKEVTKRRLRTLVDSWPALREFLDRTLTVFNGERGDRHSFDLLDDLLSAQAYRLAYWRVASDEINYRRFFDINSLAALTQEDRQVFEATHELIRRLLREGKVNGLRIDHPDGLYNPRQYLQRLQQYYVFDQVRNAVLAGRTDLNPSHPGQWEELEQPVFDAIGQACRETRMNSRRWPLYVVVEKILEGDEPLPTDWPVYGTTGYEFLNWLNGLFVDPPHGANFSRIFHRWTGMDPAFHPLLYDEKFLILQIALSSELHMLANQLDRLAQQDRWSRDFTLNSLRHALREVIACFPVYRSYIDDENISNRDRHCIESAVAQAAQKNPLISPSLFNFVRDMLLLSYADAATAEDRAEQRRFVGKFQQVTGPVMAKGLEDTAFYVYNRLVSLNEVGGDPGRFGITPEEFHAHNQERQRDWPYALSATSTHDTKRSEDVRARINVLSELPGEWEKCLSIWTRLNHSHRQSLPEGMAPDANDEYLLYQTLLGAWPVESAGARCSPEFVQRIQDYMRKAIHEAKVRTSWINPNPEYDEAVPHFVGCILDEEHNARFLEHFRAYQRRISHYGMFNSLSQTVLKLASPGVPDIYQGTELWDFSLVDPDNRRPVDYEVRQRLLDELKQDLEQAGPRRGEMARDLTRHKEDGRIKLHVTRTALRCRREHPGLFTTGTYVPLEADGPRRENVCAFLRRHKQDSAVTIVPRFFTRLMPEGSALPLGIETWGDSCLILPGVAAGQRWRNLFTDELLVTSEHQGQGCLRLAEVFANFPVALLLAQQ
jgi:(1->4)-alpha-D-glucan 1-alpha-D-glucosylmutase